MRSSLGRVAISCLLLVSTRPILARTWSVAQDGSGDFASVAAACETASASDSILIRPGVYREEGYDDPTDPAFLLSEKPLSILGDGPAETVSVQMKLWFERCYGVLLANIRLHDVPGAFTMLEGTCLIKSCRFENNEGRLEGGGAVLAYTPLDGAIVIEDSVFKGNRCLAGRGEGGAVTGSRNLTIRRCIFQGNSAASRGGAVYTGARFTVEDCFFIGNAAPHGAAVVAETDGTISRSTFYGNDCLDGMGGAIQVIDWVGILPDHCIIARTVGGFGIECPVAAAAECCDFWENEMGSDPGLWCDLSPDRGNFSEDPLFCDPEGGDFGLLEGSPCLPGNHNGYACGRIGAGAEYCGIVHTSETTWGRVKMLWR